jgi:hypothetical protein
VKIRAIILLIVIASPIAADTHLNISTFGGGFDGELYPANRDTSVHRVTAVP